LFFCLLVENSLSLNLFEHHNLLQKGHFSRLLLIYLTAIKIVVKSILILLASLASWGFNFFYCIQLDDCVDISSILGFLILWIFLLNIKLKLISTRSWNYEMRGIFIYFTIWDLLFWGWWVVLKFVRFILRRETPLTW
jgi:hypothetical protein